MERKAVVISRPGYATGWEEIIAQDYDGIFDGLHRHRNLWCELWWAVVGADEGVPG